jgi:hypothetical protein
MTCRKSVVSTLLRGGISGIITQEINTEISEKPLKTKENS